MEVNQSHNFPISFGTSSPGHAKRSTLPKYFPTYRRSASARTRGAAAKQRLIKSKLLYGLLLLIALWAYIGFHVQSKWAHDNDADNPPTASKTSIPPAANKMTNSLAEHRRISKVSKQPRSFALVRTTRRRKGKRLQLTEELQIPMKNSTYGFLVGPFGREEDETFEWSPERRTGTCDRKGEFARLVWSRRFVLVLHDLSMTGAPLSMVELATELLSCGASVSVVAISRKGGMLSELSRKKINIVNEDPEASFKAARKADLVIVGSAVCAQWVDRFISRFPRGGSKIVWWIMENRKEYFQRAKIAIERVKMVTFLTVTQRDTWLSWCKEAAIKLRNPPDVVPLSVNDELAFVAGIPSSLNSPSFPPEKMSEKKKKLRDRVRKLMGLGENDVLMMTLSSVNPGKGQLPLVESMEELRKLNTSEGSSLKLLIGSVGSKGNRISYVNEILGFLSSRPKLRKSVIWSKSSTRVAALYSAADIYVMNSQGMGETFGRVTIEAMAFGLPVVGTDAGGTKEIVEHNVSGLLYPTGRAGTRVVVENLRSLLNNSSLRESMGNNGLMKVKEMYLKRHTYKILAQVLYKTLS